MWDSPSYKKMCFHPTHPEEGEQDHVWHFTHVCVIMLVTWRVHAPRRWILPLFPTWTRLLRLNERSRDARGQHVTHGGGVVYSKTVEFTVSLLKQPMCLSFRSRPFVLFSQSITRLGCFCYIASTFCYNIFVKYDTMQHYLNEWTACVSSHKHVVHTVQ